MDILPQSLVRLIHIISATIFVGNIIVSGFWFYMANRTKKISVINFAARNTTIADVFITVPSGLLLVITGLILSVGYGGIFGTGWLLVSVSLFGVSGLIWVVFLIGYQVKVFRLSGADSSTNQISKDITKILNKWYFWGLLATIMPLISLALMILKPN